MKWLSFSFKISQERQDILLALLDSIGFEGFEQRDNELIAFIPEEKFSEEGFQDIIKQVSVSFEKKTVAEENWNSSWEKNFEPILIENNIAVRASFHQPIKNVQHEIIIDPKMAFGTGHHATTEMMMRLMLEENFSGKDVLDFGCGTGILSILASKLGASSVLAIDNDQWAAENCEENFQLNGIDNAYVILGDSIHSDKKFDFILANITREVILNNLRNFLFSLKEKGKLLMSGCLQADEERMLFAFSENDFVISKRLISEQWMAATLEKQS